MSEDAVRAEVLDAEGEDVTPRPPEGPPGPKASSSYDEEASADSAAMEAAAIDVYRPPAIMPTADEFQFIFTMADALAKSQLVPSSCRNKPADVAIILLAARDMGIPLTQALAKLHVIDSRLTLSAEVMVALVMRDGHLLWCDELTAQKATACGQRKGSPYIGRFTFTIEDAAVAGLIGKDNWQHYPKAMLWARAVSGLVRMTFPDVTAGVSYTPEEMGDAETFTAHPANALDPVVREELGARIAALTDDQRLRLKMAWSTFGLSPLSRLTEEEVSTARELIQKAEAIDVDATDPPDGAAAPPPAPAEHDSTEGGEAQQTAAHDGSDELPPDPEAVQGGSSLDGPSVFNGDTGHCSSCGGPVWYQALTDGGSWQHAEEADDLVCPGASGLLEPAGEGVDTEGLYAAVHARLSPEILTSRITAGVGALSQVEVIQALEAASLPVNGRPETLRRRLVDHRVALVSHAGVAN